jgi:hypothetical protein
MSSTVNGMEHTIRLSSLISLVLSCPKHKSNLSDWMGCMEVKRCSEVLVTFQLPENGHRTIPSRNSWRPLLKTLVLLEAPCSYTFMLCVSGSLVGSSKFPEIVIAWKWRQCIIPKHRCPSVKPLKKLNSMVRVRERTIPTERPPLVGEVIANFCG